MGLVVTGRAIRRGENLLVDDSLGVPLNEVRRLNEAHRGHLVVWTQIQFRLPVTLETPAHRQRLDLPNNFHLVDPAVTGLAPYPILDVHLMAEMNIVRQHVDVYPIDG